MSDKLTLSDEDLVLLNAHLDGELERAARAAFERRLGSEPTLRVERDRLLALRQALAAGLAKDIASDRLRDRIARIGEVNPVDLPVFRHRRFEWRQMAASAVLAAGLASALTYQLATPDRGAAAPAAIVAVHQRALLAANPVDVVSSDRHTVKPWFDSKLAVSPPVVDLATDGYALLGGRIDVVDGHSVPTLIYRHREHLVSVVAVPAAGGRDSAGAPTRASRDGYTVLTWRGTDFNFSAVSDLAPGELEIFTSKFRAAVGGS